MGSSVASIERTLSMVQVIAFHLGALDVFEERFFF
jgi:hypothetical protein